MIDMEGRIRKLLGMAEKENENVALHNLGEVTNSSSETIFQKFGKLNNQPEEFAQLSSVALRKDLDELVEFQEGIFRAVEEIKTNLNTLAKFIDNLYEALKSD